MPDDTKLPLGFIGLGTMGREMARRLLEAGHPLSVWNRTASRAADLVAAGAHLAGSPAALAAGSQVILTCVSDTPDVKGVLLGPEGVVEGLQPGSLIIDMSTISPAATREIAATLRERGAGLVDAPVSGGPEGAAKGTLSIMVGGDAADVEKAMPVLRILGQTITYVGASGAGQMAKAVNQVIVVITALAVSEGLLLAQAGGLDLTQTIEAIQGGAAGSWMLRMRGTQAAIRDFRPGFTIDLQQKDLRIALETADELGVPMLGSALVFNLYRALQAQGLGQEGNHALIKALEQMSGIEVGQAAGQR